jgi:hypothetical protein
MAPMTFFRNLCQLEINILCEYCGNTGLCYVLFFWISRKVYLLGKKGFLRLKTGLAKNQQK